MNNIKIKGIQNILRATHVKRWHIVNTSREQNLAEHHWNVTMIARAIAVKVGSDVAAVTEYALTHDLDEVVLGDFPSPTKEWLATQGMVFNKNGDMNWEHAIIVKLADLLEMLWFVEDHGIGRHATLVADKLSNKIDDMIKGGDISIGIKEAFWHVSKELFEGEFQNE